MVADDAPRTPLATLAPATKDEQEGDAPGDAPGDGECLSIVDPRARRTILYTYHCCRDSSRNTFIETSKLCKRRSAYHDLCDDDSLAASFASAAACFLSRSLHSLLE